MKSRVLHLAFIAVAKCDAIPHNRPPCEGAGPVGFPAARLGFIPAVRSVSCTAGRGRPSQWEMAGGVVTGSRVVARSTGCQTRDAAGSSLTREGAA